MEKVKKYIAVLILAVFAFTPAFTAIVPETEIKAEAQDLIDKDMIEALKEYLGVEELTFDAVMKAIAKNAEGIKNLFPAGSTIGDIIKELKDYFFGFEDPTTKAPETTTEAPTQAPPPPPPTVPYPNYNGGGNGGYNGGGSYVPPPTVPQTTEPAETTTFKYIPPEQIYTEVYTTAPFKPVVQDEVSEVKDSSPLKTGLGITLLVLSGVGVIVVAIKLKKTNI